MMILKPVSPGTLFLRNTKIVKVLPYSDARLFPVKKKKEI